MLTGFSNDQQGAEDFFSGSCSEASYIFDLFLRFCKTYSLMFLPNETKIVQNKVGAVYSTVFDEMETARLAVLDLLVVHRIGHTLHSRFDVSRSSVSTAFMVVIRVKRFPSEFLTVQAQPARPVIPVRPSVSVTR